MDVGARVKVVRGRKSLGAAGVVFWVGANRYGPGQRLGIHSDDGQTLWIDRAHVVALDPSAAVSVSLHDESEQEQAARAREDLAQIHAEMERAEKSPVHLAPYCGAVPTAPSHASQKRGWVDSAATRVRLPKTLGEVRGADERGKRLLVCGDWRVVEVDLTTGQVLERALPREKERLLDVCFVDDTRWALLTAERLYLLGPDSSVLDVARVRRDVIEAVFDGRALVVYGDYGEPMLYGVAHDRMKRLGTTRARVVDARVVDGHLLFEAHGELFEMVGALSAIEALERKTTTRRSNEKSPKPRLDLVELAEAPTEVKLWSPWSLDAEAGRFPGHPLLSRALTGRIVATWDPRRDLGGDHPRRTHLGLSDAPGHLVDLTSAVTEHIQRAITDLALDPTGRWLFFQSHRTIKRLDLESLEVTSVHPRVDAFQAASGGLLITLSGERLAWLEEQSGGFREVAAGAAKGRHFAHSSELDCAFVFGDQTSKVQAHARVGSRLTRVWTTKEPFIRASFAGQRVFLYRHACAVSELSGLSAVIAHARSKKRR